MKLELIGTCVSLDAEFINSLTQNANRKIDYKKTVRYIKKNYPFIYQEFALDYPNPYAPNSRQNSQFLWLVHSGIEIVFKKIK